MASKFLVKIARRDNLPEDCNIIGCIGTGDELYLLISDSTGEIRAYSDLIQRHEDVHFSKALYWIPDELKKVYLVGYSDGVNDTLVKIFGKSLLGIFRNIYNKFFVKKAVTQTNEKIGKHTMTKRRKVYVEDDGIRIDRNIEEGES